VLLSIKGSNLKYIVTFIGIVFSTITFSYEKVVDGGSLYLIRGGFETHRAEFDSPQDCKLVAETMNKKEPNVKWLCSTSENPREYKCNLKGVTIINSDKNTQETVDLDFKISMTRGKANTTLTSAVSSFDYVQSDEFIKLTNDYPYVNGNYFSRAITYITIDRGTWKLQAINFELQQNGVGGCDLVTK